jgi:tetratricopeptide (TPR) repeat protein
MPDHADCLISKADELYVSGRCDEAVQLLTGALAEDRPDPALLTRSIELLIDSERYERALELFERYGHPNDTGSGLLLRAICHEALGDLANVDQLVQELVASGRQSAETLALKGKLALRRLKWESAEALFFEAIACDNDCGNAWFGLACLYRQRADVQKAFEFSKQAFLRSPGSRQIAIGLHQSALNAQRTSEGESALREALCRRRMDRRLRFLLIDLILRQDRWKDAMAEIESVLVDFGVDEGSLSAARMVRERLGPMRTPPEADPGTTVSLCMIVKNESSHLPRCLISAQPLVDEIIVVDTGSTDTSADIARVFGARVYGFPWVDDFSAARNFGLSKASGDWILVLDADEVISCKSHGDFRPLLQQPVKRGGCAFRVQTRNYTNHANTIGWKPNRGEYPDEAGMGWFPSDKVRVFPNDARIRFTNPVHELVEPCLRELRIPIRGCDIPVHHYGKLGETLTQEKTKQYRTLSQKNLQKTHRDASGLRELAIQSTQLEQYEDALDLWKELLTHQPKSTEAHLNMSAAYWNLGRYSDALKSARKALHLSPEVKEASFNQAITLLMMGGVEAAKSILERLVDKHPEYSSALFMLGIAYACAGRQQPIEAVLNNIRSLPLGQFLGESFLDIAKRLLNASQPALARRVLEAAVTHQCATAEVLALLERCRASG